MEAKKAREEAEQQGYDLRLAEIKETFRVKVLVVCRIYCTQTWDEALTRDGVKASSELTKPENIYLPPAIRVSDPLFTQGEVASTVAEPVKEMQPLDPPCPSQQQQIKETEAPKEKSSDKAAEVPEDGVASQSFEQALTSITMPAREAPKEKEEIIPAKADKLARKTSKDKIQIKLKQ